MTGQPAASAGLAGRTAGRPVTAGTVVPVGNAAEVRCDDPTGHCHLCGDVAAIGRVVALDPDARVATVLLPDGPAIVAMDFVDASVGDNVLVQLGFALERMPAS